MIESYKYGTGLYQQQYEKLERLIPREGPVDKAGDNPMLERFRKANNLYSAVYKTNHSDTNEFRYVFGFPIGSTSYVDAFNKRRMEKAFTSILLDAWAEQDNQRRL